MRFNRRTKGGGTQEMNMTPMIDVVFLLMIYFMTTLNAKSISKEPLDLPRQRGTQDQSELALTINVDRGGRIIVSGETLTLPQLITLVSEHAGSDPASLDVVIRADRAGNSRTINQVSSRLLKLGVGKVRFATEKPE
jgi:biopolymer transport protein ExbD